MYPHTPTPSNNKMINVFSFQAPATAHLLAVSICPITMDYEYMLKMYMFYCTNQHYLLFELYAG